MLLMTDDTQVQTEGRWGLAEIHAYSGDREQLVRSIVNTRSAGS